jgi:DNA polymerase-1
MPVDPAAVVARLGLGHVEDGAHHEPRPLSLPPAAAGLAKLAGVIDIEMNALPCVAWASVHGVGFNRAAWELLARDAEDRRDELHERLDAIAPSTGDLFGVTNWNSPKQVLAAFRKHGITLESTGDDALAAVDHPLAETLREYRSAARLATTYGRDWLRHVAADGRVYATWKQIGAGASGRMSCKEPNLQQLPRDARYRRCFVAPPGRVLVKADHSQIELRIAAKIANDKRMLDAYRGGEDLHTLTARSLLGTTEVTKADRQLAKAVNFGLLYGQGVPGLGRYTLANYGVRLTEAEAARHRETFFATSTRGSGGGTGRSGTTRGILVPWPVGGARR